MASRQIEYIWKVARPRNEAIARALMHAAYLTAIETDPNATQVLIRSYVHSSTHTRGVYKKDGPHVTISVKNPESQQQATHQTSHGYTTHAHSFNVVRVVPSNYVKPDTMADAWPARMATRPKDVVDGEPALLGPKDDFITWPSDQTGE